MSLLFCSPKKSKIMGKAKGTKSQLGEAVLYCITFLIFIIVSIIQAATLDYEVAGLDSTDLLNGTGISKINVNSPAFWKAIETKAIADCKCQMQYKSSSNGETVDTICGCEACRYPCDVCNPNDDYETDSALHSCYGLVYCYVSCPLDHVCDPKLNEQKTTHGDAVPQCATGYCGTNGLCADFPSMECSLQEQNYHMFTTVLYGVVVFLLFVLVVYQLHITTRTTKMFNRTILLGLALPFMGMLIISGIEYSICKNQNLSSSPGRYTSMCIWCGILGLIYIASLPTLFMATKGMTSSGKVGTMGIFLMGAILFAQEIVFNKINIEQATAEMFNRPIHPGVPKNKSCSSEEVNYFVIIITALTFISGFSAFSLLSERFRDGDDSDLTDRAIYMFAAGLGGPSFVSWIIHFVFYSMCKSKGYTQLATPLYMVCVGLCYSMAVGGNIYWGYQDSKSAYANIGFGRTQSLELSTMTTANPVSSNKDVEIGGDGQPIETRRNPFCRILGFDLNMYYRVICLHVVLFAGICAYNWNVNANVLGRNQAFFNE